MCILSPFQRQLNETMYIHLLMMGLPFNIWPASTTSEEEYYATGSGLHRHPLSVFLLLSSRPPIIMTPSTNKPCQNSLRDLTFQKIFLFVILFLGELSASCKVSEI